MTTDTDSTERPPRRGRGRPPIPVHERRTHLVGVFVNEAELTELRRRGDATGMADLATYVRRAVLAQRPPRGVVPAVNVAAYQDLARTAANLNQVTRHLNEGGRLDATGTARLADVLDRLTAQVRALRLALMRGGDDGDDG